MSVNQQNIFCSPEIKILKHFVDRTIHTLNDHIKISKINDNSLTKGSEFHGWIHNPIV